MDSDPLVDELRKISSTHNEQFLRRLYDRRRTKAFRAYHQMRMGAFKPK